jgi:hypothetical protein
MTTITAPANGGGSSRDLATFSTTTPVGGRTTRHARTLLARSSYSPEPPDGGVLRLALRSSMTRAARSTAAPSFH